MTITDRTSANDFRDYYEALQLSPNADADTITRVYHILVKRYHPDNAATADPERFAEVLAAHRVLSDPDRRLAYNDEYRDHRSAAQPLHAQPINGANGNGNGNGNGSGNFQSDRRVTEAVLSLLYVARRRNPEHAGMGPVQMERSLSCPPEFLEFHIWYLLEKNWIQRLSNGMLAITASGVDRVIEGESLLRRDRLISETASVEDPNVRMLR